jgi:hypothetical protein
MRDGHAAHGTTFGTLAHFRPRFAECVLDARQCFAAKLGLVGLGVRQRRQIATQRVAIEKLKPGRTHIIQRALRATPPS